jgi:hypothetical protein
MDACMHGWICRLMYCTYRVGHLKHGKGCLLSLIIHIVNVNDTLNLRLSCCRCDRLLGYFNRIDGNQRNDSIKRFEDGRATRRPRVMEEERRGERQHKAKERQVCVFQLL